MADPSLRSLYLTAQFACDVGQGKCRDLTTPGLAEMYPQLMSHVSKKRKLEEAVKSSGPASGGGEMSAKAKKRAKRKEAKAKAQAAKADADRRAAQSQRDRAANQKGGKGAGASKGAGRGSNGGGGGKGQGKMNLPDGAVRTNPNTTCQLCYGWNLGNACSKTPCNFEHACWFCFDTTHKGKDCPMARGPAPAPGR